MDRNSFFNWARKPDHQPQQLQHEQQPRPQPTPTTPSPPFHPRTTSLLATTDAAALVPLWDPISSSIRVVPRDRICAIRERDGGVVLTVEGCDDLVIEGGLRHQRRSDVLEGGGELEEEQREEVRLDIDNVIEEEDEVEDEGFLDPTHSFPDPATALRQKIESDREWSRHPSQRALTILPTASFIDFIQEHCPKFPILDEITDAETTSPSKHSPTTTRPRAALNPTRILSLHPDFKSRIPGCVLADLGHRAPWLRTKTTSKPIRSRVSTPRQRVASPQRVPDVGEGVAGLEVWSEAEEEDVESRVRVRVKGDSLLDVLGRIEPEQWEDVALGEVIGSV